MSFEEFRAFYGLLLNLDQIKQIPNFFKIDVSDLDFDDDTYCACSELAEIIQEIDISHRVPHDFENHRGDVFIIGIEGKTYDRKVISPISSGIDWSSRKTKSKLNYLTKLRRYLCISNRPKLFYVPYDCDCCP